MADLPGDETIEVVLIDGAGVNEVAVSTAGAVSGNQTHVGGSTITLGQKPMAMSYPVTLASDQTAVPVTFSPIGGQVGLQLVYESTSSAPLVKDEWQDLLTYTVPSGYDFNGTWFYLFSGGVDRARTIQQVGLGSYNCSTNVFTDGSSVTAPSFLALLYVYITTATGGVADTTITITYTNQDGVTGRTATLLLLKNTPAGRRIRVLLQGTDYGIRDVTAVSDNSANTGVFNIEGVIELLFQGGNGTVVNTMYGTATAVGAIIFPSGQEIRLQYRSATAGAVERKISLTGVLIPT